jgi:predicted PurR-regulated permease PerM
VIPGVRWTRRTVRRVLLGALYLAGFAAAWDISPIIPLALVALVVAAVAYRLVRVHARGDRDPRDGDLQ